MVRENRYIHCGACVQAFCAEAHDMAGREMTVTEVMAEIAASLRRFGPETTAGG
jgi:hypothetical protein